MIGILSIAIVSSWYFTSLKGVSVKVKLYKPPEFYYTNEKIYVEFIVTNKRKDTVYLYPVDKGVYTGNANIAIFHLPSGRRFCTSHLLACMPFSAKSMRPWKRIFSIHIPPYHRAHNIVEINSIFLGEAKQPLNDQFVLKGGTVHLLCKGDSVFPPGIDCLARICAKGRREKGKDVSFEEMKQILRKNVAPYCFGYGWYILQATTHEEINIVAPPPEEWQVYTRLKELKEIPELERFLETHSNSRYAPLIVEKLLHKLQNKLKNIKNDEEKENYKTKINNLKKKYSGFLVPKVIIEPIELRK